jgi:MFS family permease
MVLLLLLGGVWSDRLPRHFVLVSCDLVRGGSQAATAALLLTHTASVVDVALLQVAYGGASAFGRPAFQGLVPQVTPVERLQEANALLGLSNSAVQIAGPAVGAIIVAAAAPGWRSGRTR